MKDNTRKPLGLRLDVREKQTVLYVILNFLFIFD